VLDAPTLEDEPKSQRVKDMPIQVAVIQSIVNSAATHTCLCVALIQLKRTLTISEAEEWPAA
jgi:hypothetical protein